ncbi:hypothetical protein RGQ29_008518 [Quercus rubra]|uniref:Uncharacterized protein n=2 Tax=Quercus rubra TaxID=3512 RepID=A0AAN7E0L3_QUERU|nr:hypothetical protein RGQ29_008518 [Quercus rubra]
MVMCGEWFSRIYGKVGKWCHDYIFFSKAVPFIFGLVVSHTVINSAVVEVFIDYLATAWEKDPSLPTAATIVNLQDGISTVSAVVVAYIADSYLNCFTTIVICALTYTMGLMLLWCSAHSSSIRTHYGPIYVAAFAVALGKCGLDSILKEFLSEQLIEGEKENSYESEAQIEGRTNVWWCIASISGSAIAVFWLSYVTWERTFLACNVMMGASLLLFLCGFKFYCPERHNRNSHVIFKVFKAAISKRYLAYPGTPTQLSWKSEPNLKLYEEKNSQILLLPKVFWFRWLDKAAVTVEKTSSSPQEEENLCSVEQVTQVKCFLTLIPLWTTFLAYSLVQATGNTFFIEQSSNLKNTFTQKDARVLLVAFFVLNSFLRFIIPRLFWSEKARNPNVTLVKIGVGMICSILCCIAAWQVEVHRLKEIERLQIKNQFDTISMSILWLLPQFILLGLTEGLVEEGLQEFFSKHVTKSMWNAGQLLTGCILSFGNFFSIPCVQLVRSWFKGTINDSHLDRYFLTLAILSSVFLCFYVYASISNSKYADIRDLSKEAELAPNVSIEEVEMKDEMSLASSSARNTPLNEDLDDHPSHSILNLPQGDGVEGNTKPLPTRNHSFLWTKVPIVMGFTHHLYSRLANVEMTD